MLATAPNFEVVQEAADGDEVSETTAETAVEIKIETETLVVNTIIATIEVVHFETAAEKGSLIENVTSGTLDQTAEKIGVGVVAHICTVEREAESENGTGITFTIAIPHHAEVDHQTCDRVVIREMDI